MGDFSMKLLSFEANKIKNKRLLATLVIAPVLVMLTIFVSRLFITVDFRAEEVTQANQLLADLSWQIPNYHHVELDPYIEVSEEDRYLYELVDEAERYRFDYSVAAFYEEWHDVNVAKQNIWDLLIEIVELGPELKALNLEELHTEKHLLDWAVDYEVGTYDFETDTNSLFVLFSSFSILFSLPAIMLVIFFFCLPIFLEPERSEFNFSKVLPISYAKMMAQKLVLFFSILVTYIFSAIGISLLLAIFDSVSLKAQLQYPMMIYQGADLIIKPLWQVLLFQILFFIALALVSLAIVTLFAKLFNNELFISFIYTTLIMIGLQVTRLTPSRSLTFIPIAWFDPDHFLLYQTTESIVIVLIILYSIAMLLAWLVLLRPINLPRWQRKARCRGMIKDQKNFLFKFEWLKLHRQAILFYSTAILAAFTLYQAVDSYQDQVVNFETADNNFSTKIAEYEEQISQNLEHAEYVETFLDSPDLPLDWVEDYEQQLVVLEQERNKIEAKLVEYQAIEAEVLEGNYSGLNQLELKTLENDYRFVDRLGDAEDSELIPKPDHIFVPNAYINYRLSEWKVEHEIDFVPPGAPYETMFLPTYQQSPRSGDDEPPAMIERDVFDRYLAEVGKEHHYLSGLNLLADFFNQHYYLVLLILLVGFYSLSYVREWDGSGTIRYLLVQPISLTKTFLSKVVASLAMGVCFTTLVGLIIFLIGSLLNGVGQLNFPFIQYMPYTAGADMHEQLFQIPTLMDFFRIVPVWQWLLMGAGLLLSNLFMINQLVYYVSTYIKNQWAVMASSLAILGLGFVIAIVWPHDVQAFLPFQYLDISQVLSGRIATINEYSHLTWSMGMIVQTATGIILLLLSLVRIQRTKHN